MTVRTLYKYLLFLSKMECVRIMMMDGMLESLVFLRWGYANKVWWFPIGLAYLRKTNCYRIALIYVGTCEDHDNDDHEE